VQGQCVVLAGKKLRINTRFVAEGSEHGQHGK
jgi:hypothetical protein